jgi:hypothetical protein
MAEAARNLTPLMTDAEIEARVSALARCDQDLFAAVLIAADSACSNPDRNARQNYWRFVRSAAQRKLNMALN